MVDLPRELRGFRERLADAINRTTHGNLSAFARLCGVADSTLKQYLDGTSLPGLANLLRIALTAGATLDTLALGPREERAAASLTAKDQLEVLTLLLRAADVADLPAPARTRYRERVQYVEALMRRLVYDVDQYLSELREHAAHRAFDGEKFRAEWTAPPREEDKET